MNEYGVVTDSGKVIAISKVVDGRTVSPMFFPSGDCTYDDCLDMAKALIHNSQNTKEAEKTALPNTTKATIALLDKYENSKSRYHLEGLSELRMFRRFVEEMAQQ